MLADLIRYRFLSRREFLAGSAVIATGLVLPAERARSEPNVTAPPTPPTPAPVILRDLSSAGIDSVRVSWRAEAADCSARIEIAGIFDQEVETRILDNAMSGIIISDLPSRSLYTVRLKSVCSQSESEWSEPVNLCTALPRPKGLSAQALPLGGATSVAWDVAFDRPVLNTDSLRFRLFRRRGTEVVVVHETAVDGNLAGRLYDATFGPGDAYHCQVFGPDLADRARAVVSPDSDAVRPLLLSVSIPRAAPLQSVPTLSTVGDRLGNWKMF